MSFGRLAAKMLAPVGMKVAPQFTAGFVRGALDRAIDGVGVLPGAAASANTALAESGGVTEKAIDALIQAHVGLAGAEGFLTNIGGAVTAAVAVPANVAGLALVQCHLVAGIAHLHGYHLADRRVRAAVLACMLGEQTVHSLIQQAVLPGDPRAIATGPALEAEFETGLAATVSGELIARVGGRRMVLTMARRVPVLGGAVGATADAGNTWVIGRYTRNVLAPR